MVIIMCYCPCSTQPLRAWPELVRRNRRARSGAFLDCTMSVMHRRGGGINIYSWWRNLLPFLLQLPVFWSKLLQKPKSLLLIRIVLSIMSCTRSYACLPFQGFMHEVNILVCLSVWGEEGFWASIIIKYYIVVILPHCRSGYSSPAWSGKQKPYWLVNIKMVPSPVAKFLGTLANTEAKPILSHTYLDTTDKSYTYSIILKCCHVIL